MFVTLNKWVRVFNYSNNNNAPFVKKIFEKHI